MSVEELRGRAAYEADLAKRPTYGDGSPRRTWEQLDEIARWSWSRALIAKAESDAKEVADA